MLGRILKKDLKKRKGVNLILFLFIAIATVFLASSVNNILVVTPAVDYYMDYANVPDVYFNIVGTGGGRGGRPLACKQQSGHRNLWKKHHDDHGG